MVEKKIKTKVSKYQDYGTGDVVVIYKNSNRSNGRKFYKVFSNTNVDWVNSVHNKQIPEKAVIVKIISGVDGFLLRQIKREYTKG